MSDITSQTIDFNDKHTIKVSGSGNDQSLLIHIDNTSSIPVSVTGSINTTLSDESVINKISELGKISELTKITEPVEVRNASTDLDMLKDVALQLYTYADFEKIKNRVDYAFLCFDRAYDYVKAFHIFLARKKHKHFIFKFYDDANSEEIKSGITVYINYSYETKNILNKMVDRETTEQFKIFNGNSNIIECKLSHTNGKNIKYTIKSDDKTYLEQTGVIPDDSLDSIFEIYLEQKTDN